MAIGHLHVATATVTVTIEVAATTTIAVMADDMITRSQRTAVTSATYLRHQRQATPTAYSSKPRGRST
jgi:hypothetical protein